MCTPQEEGYLEEIELLMKQSVPLEVLPENVEISKELTPEERPEAKEIYNPLRRGKDDEDAPGPAFHEKKEKNKKVNLGGSYKRIILSLIHI